MPKHILENLALVINQTPLSTHTIFTPKIIIIKNKTINIQQSNTSTSTLTKLSSSSSSLPTTSSMEDPHFTTKLLLFITWFLSPAMVASVGINYGQIANNLPSPERVVPIVKSIGATRVKLYDADPKVLKAFANTGVEFIVGLGNEYLSKMTDPNNAQAWVKANVQAYLPATKITSIAVGNEVLTFNDTSLSGCLLPAMQSVHTALVNLKLDSQVTVTTAHSVAVLQNSYPPSSGAFRPDLKGCISPILDFLSKTCSPFLINAYPFFAYKANPKQVSLDFVLFQPNAGITDPANNLHYDNMLFAQIDAVYAALNRLGYNKMPVQISETGWPSKGDDDELGASPENAKKYNGNLLKIISQKKGTPARPNTDLNIFVFAMFNENLKPGPTSERNYGLFKPDGTPAYGLGFSGISVSGGNSTSTGGNSPGTNGPGVYLSPPANSSNGYMDISLSPEKVIRSSWRRLGMGLMLILMAMAFGI
ncbi:putative glucan endo-1,3-beta-D-glucosidase [Helianthus debilis subsp. tardiflorus]